MSTTSDEQPREKNLTFYSRESEEALKAISLVAENPLPQQTALALLYSITASSEFGRTQRLREDGHLVVHILASLGHHLYNNGKFWPVVKKALYEYETQVVAKYPDKKRKFHWPEGIETELGKAYVVALEKIQKAKSPDPSGLKYVSHILFQAGIPKNCSENFVRVVSENLRYTSDPISLYNRLLGPALTQLVKPNRRFLEGGDLYAISLLERVIEGIHVVRTKGNLESLDLSDSLKQSISKYATTATVSTSSNKRHQMPFLSLDPYMGSLSLVLPQVRNVTSDFFWNVRTERKTDPVFPNIDFAETGVQATRWTVDSPVIQLDVWGSAYGHDYSIPVVNPNQPVLFFDINGKIENVRLELPPKKLWVLSSTEIENTSDLRIEREGNIPLGWTSWKLVLVDLSDANELKIDGRSFRIRKISLPHLIHQNAQEFSGATLNMLPILSGEIKLFLPKDVDKNVWNVSITNLETGLQTPLATVLDESNQMVIQMPSELGTFEVKVKGPWGRELTEAFAYIHDFSITTMPEVRLFDKNELESAKITLRINSQVVEHELRRGSNQLSIPVGDMNLVYRPKSMAATTRDFGVPKPWKFSSAEIPDIDAKSNSTLLVRWPGRQSVKLKLVSIANSIGYTDFSDASIEAIQEISGDKLGVDGEFEFDLKKAAATIDNFPHLRLIANSGSIFIQVGKIFPDKLFEKVEIVENNIRLHNRARIDLMVYLWSMDSPWIEPLKIHMPFGTDEVEIDTRFTESRFFTISAEIYSKFKELQGVPAEIPQSRKYIQRDFQTANLDVDQFVNFKLNEATTQKDFWNGIYFLAKTWKRTNSRDRHRLIDGILQSNFESQSTKLQELVSLNLSEKETLELMLLTKIADQKPELKSSVETFGPLLSLMQIDTNLAKPDLDIQMREILEKAGSGAKQFWSTGVWPQPEKDRVKPNDVKYLSLPHEARQAIKQILALVPKRPTDSEGRAEVLQNKLEFTAGYLKDPNDIGNLNVRIFYMHQQLKDISHLQNVIPGTEQFAEVKNETPTEALKILVQIPDFIRYAAIYLRAVANGLIEPISHLGEHDKIEKLLSRIWQHSIDICYTDFLIAELACVRAQLVKIQYKFEQLEEETDDDSE